MSSNIRHDIALSLQAMEQEMRRIRIWEALPPTLDRLNSEVPFCHDTLEFTQWVQWVFIPRFQAVLEGDHPLPQSCAIAPMAEDALARLEGDTDPLLALFRALDSTITEEGNRP